MPLSIMSDIVKISKDVVDIEQVLSEICGGEIIRWAITDVQQEYYKISCSYKSPLNVHKIH
ncbi:hypothetical protein J6N69_06035 [bacterium]|nr:hypothetical protein [bacterium]